MPGHAVTGASDTQAGVSSMAASANASFSSGKSFIAAQHPSEEEQALAEGPLFREDRSMTHEGILLHESPQVSPCTVY